MFLLIHWDPTYEAFTRTLDMILTLIHQYR
jgi:hypothetical protein